MCAHSKTTLEENLNFERDNTGADSWIYRKDDFLWGASTLKVALGSGLMFNLLKYHLEPMSVAWRMNAPWGPCFQVCGPVLLESAGHSCVHQLICLLSWDQKRWDRAVFSHLRAWASSRKSELPALGQLAIHLENS